MTGEKWQTAWQIYSAAREMTLGARKSFLDSASSDPEIIREVLLLLEQSEGQGPDPTGPDSISTPGSQFLNEKQWYGKFEITGSLGRGGMGQVFSARDTELGRNVALKFLNPGATLHPAATQKLLREAQTASALNHPNIVTIHEVIRSESSIAIVMELVEGQSVREFCKKRLPIEKVISIGQQIARALAAAHALGIVHRDIKPENIIVRPDGGVKVLDFGLARQVSTFSEHSNPSLPAGTLRYMSPEQAHGQAATSASDVFSFGLVLHELLTGHHAFPEDTPVETVHAIMVKDQSGELPHDIPVELGRLIKSMLAKIASKRPSAEQVAAELDEILAVREAPDARAGRRTWGILTLALLLATVSAAVWLTKADGMPVTSQT